MPGGRTYEAQWGEEGGRFWLAICITSGESQWTSRRAWLEATDKESAQREIAKQLSALYRSLEPAQLPRLMAFLSPANGLS